jgi:hypothetical protein
MPRSKKRSVKKVTRDVWMVRTAYGDVLVDPAARPPRPRATCTCGVEGCDFNTDGPPSYVGGSARSQTLCVAGLRSVTGLSIPKGPPVRARITIELLPGATE